MALIRKTFNSPAKNNQPESKFDIMAVRGDSVDCCEDSIFLIDTLLFRDCTDLLPTARLSLVVCRDSLFF